ncbi:cellulose 1,4-beta-cellobiosidase [Actinobacteria bacterium YIM 96077]|uniref:Cellulose 1,4-beta-cellobiosidase n=1 Tax=Phytoactinopolyspora halophila TaxID=1981511 RepID=A0A329R357_9ACTN|nr:glycoside hydrolase family 48 protein [Phytoactinopolyspora halophila]AYY11565.1 cellulose 1,4-beta-cellobiosidase [Actinobacteria bacterium YIM 96077]RAW17952.1 cellulose 1,4-beta-cellobiosidase [Phytoactinopolyspora halophila]
MAKEKRWRPAAALAAGALVAAGLTAIPGTAHAAVACDVDFGADEWGDGSGGFTGEVVLTNLGDPLDDWTLSFDLPGDAQLVQGWNADWEQDGQEVSAHGPSWNSLDTGEQATLGFNGTGYAGDPDEFFVNGTLCGDDPGTTAPEVSIASPADGAEFTAPADVTVEAEASSEDGEIDRVEFYLDGSLAGDDTTAPYSFLHEDLSEGTYVLGVQAVDDQDQTAEDEITIEVADDGDPDVVATPDQVSVVEGSTASYGVSLTEEPDGEVTVTTEHTSGGSGIDVVEGDVLTFTSGNWDEPQDVVLAADEGSAGESAEFTSDAPGHTPASVTANALPDDGEVDPEWVDRFMEQYEKIHDSGYFSSHGIPYHSIETLIVEAPDYGHVTTSEAFSFWLWMEANYGRITEDWEPFNEAWETMETYIIPGSDDQPSAGVDGDAIYAAEHPQPSMYPSALDSDVPVGEDPLRDELEATHGTGEIYGMHWLLDVDNTYGYGHCGDGTTSPSYINTFQRGEQESVWETVPHPSCETFDFGGEQGFLDLFVEDPDGGATQWRYTNAPDADARAVQAAYWALTWAREQGNESAIASTVADAATMGDYLRYSLFDKYFKEIGECVGATECPAGSGRSSAHYLLSWYYSWGGSYPGDEWSWRIGSSHNHFGYQNPMSAYAMVNEPALQTESPTFVDDWEESLERTLEFYLWLQSDTGAIAGGATNSWGGHYGEPEPMDDGSPRPTFYGMYYDEHPVYEDPGSNEWFGMQVWSLQRAAEYLYLTGDERAQQVLDRWVPWAMSETEIGEGGDFAIPATLDWSGYPDTWDENGDPLEHTNPNLTVEVTDTGQDVGVAAAYARTLMWYAAATGDTEAQEMSRDLLEALYEHRDEQGIAVEEEREDYSRFLDVHDEPAGSEAGVFIPEGWQGVMGNGEEIEPGVTFLDLRSFYLDDPDIDQVLDYASGETDDPPTFEYHRSWAQMDIANAFADYAHLFPDD